MTEAKRWSAELRESTRSQLEDLSCGMGPQGISLMHIEGAFGLLKVEDAANGRWIITDRKTGETVRFDSIADLVAADWALD